MVARLRSIPQAILGLPSDVWRGSWGKQNYPKPLDRIVYTVVPSNVPIVTLPMDIILKKDMVIQRMNSAAEPKGDERTQFLHAQTKPGLQ